MIIIKTSTDSHKAMKKIANELLNNKLAACVNMIPRMRSKYVMDGRIVESREVILLIKTSKNLETKVYKVIKELHNYEIPEISTIQTSNVDKDYDKWLNDFVESE
jgi:periplasmic divalent cation tolerance protein